MNNSEDDYEPARYGRPNVPSPFVTHQEIGPLHRRIGALEKGQESLTAYLGAMRAEMLTQFERVEKILREQMPSMQQGVQLSTREIVIAAAALVLTGMFLGKLGFDRLLN